MSIQNSNLLLNGDFIESRKYYLQLFANTNLAPKKRKKSTHICRKKHCRALGKGKARQGKARQGKARQGKHVK